MIQKKMDFHVKTKMFISAIIFKDLNVHLIDKNL